MKLGIHEKSINVIRKFFVNFIWIVEISNDKSQRIFSDGIDISHDFYVYFLKNSE